MPQTALDRSSALLGRSLRRIGGHRVRYVHAGEVVEVEAVPGRTLHEQYGTEDEHATAEEFDWCQIQRDALVIAGAAFLPTPGDQIIFYHPIRKQEQTYLVQPTTDDRCYHWHDQTQQTLRVHTILTPTADNS